MLYHLRDDVVAFSTPLENVINLLVNIVLSVLLLLVGGWIDII